MKLHLRASLFLLFAVAVCLPAPASAQSYSIVHNFDDGSVTNDGGVPYAGLLQGTDGNLYGTTAAGGSGDYFQYEEHFGTVYKITTSGTETVLYSFPSMVDDGLEPWAGLIQGRDGNFYGTTQVGGDWNANYGDGYGTVFKISSNGTETILHSFSDGSVADDGVYPQAALIQGSDGNFYGTTYQGGSTASLINGVLGYGTAFKIDPEGNLTILHSFGDGSVPHDGTFPSNSLVEGPDGNYYGTTAEGGTAFGGTAFRITPSGQFTILDNFDYGSLPNNVYGPGEMILGNDGNFYGVAGGGSAGYGSVFKMSTSGQITLLHSFGDGSVINDGHGPIGIIQATDGNFYGTTYSGGSTVAADPNHNGYGTIFEMTPTGAVTILHSFDDGTVADDGYNPMGNLALGIDGAFYGTTSAGGAAGSGMVYRLALPPYISNLESVMNFWRQNCVLRAAER